MLNAFFLFSLANPPKPSPSPPLSLSLLRRRTSCIDESLFVAVERAESRDEWRLPDMARSTEEGAAASASPLAIRPPRSRRWSVGRLSTAAGRRCWEASGPWKKTGSMLLRREKGENGCAKERAKETNAPLIEAKSTTSRVRKRRERGGRKKKPLQFSFLSGAPSLSLSSCCFVFDFDFSRGVHNQEQMQRKYKTNVMN